MIDFFSKLFDASDYPPRWTCGRWTASEGWLHILSDLSVWAAYLAIPLVLVYFLRHKKDLPFRKIFLLFGAFILLCGTTHLMDAIVFWWPAYRLSGLIKLATGIVSWATVAALFSVLPEALRLRSPEDLEREIAARKQAEENLTSANAALEQRVEERTRELTKAVTDLQTSEMRYRRLFEASQDGVLLLDPDSQIIIDANPFMTQLLGYPCEKLLGMKLFQIGLFKDESANREMFTKLNATGQTRYDDLPLVSSDGRTHEVEVVANLYNEAGRSVIQCSIRDISIRKNAEISANRLAAIINSSADSIISTDLNGIVTSWNQGAAQIFGYTAEEMIGTSITRLIPPDRLDEEKHILAKIRRGEKAQHAETIRQTKDGRLIHVSVTASPVKDSTGKVIGASKVARDITDRKLAEAALRESNQRFRGTFENAAVGIAHVAPDGRWLRINTRICEITGYAREELLSKTFQEITHPDDLDADLSQLNRLLAGEIDSYTMEKRYVRKDGTTMWVNLTVSASPTPEGKTDYLIAVVEDISRRKQSEAELRASDERFRTLFESAPMAVFSCDRDAVIQHYNRRAAELWGREPVRGVEKHCGSVKLWLMDGTELPLWQSPIVEVLRTGVPAFNVEVFIERPDGEFLPVMVNFAPLKDAQGIVTGAITTFFDTIELKRAEEGLRASEQRVRLATEATGVGIWEWNVITNEVRWDAQMFRIYGVARTENGCVSYKPWADALLPEDRERHEAVLRELIRTRGTGNLEFCIVRADNGERRTILSVETVRTDLEGKVEWVVGTNLDITESKLAANKLSEAKEAAEAANRSKDRFLAVLSHELRTPLTPVLMTVASWEHDPDLRTDVREDMSMIRRNIEIETQLIDDLLDVSRIVNGKLELRTEPLELNAALLHVCSICRPQLLGQEVHLALDLSEEAGFINADPARFEQVIWNVLKNAVKFTPRNGKIHVSSKRLSQTHVEVRITDSGEGIPADILPRIFDAFEQGDARITRQFGGLGLGLAISKALIELHGGSIRAESPGRGKGATFIVELPGTQVKCAGIEKPAEPERVETPALRLLVVEDHPDTARALKILLSREGFSVTTVGTTASALAIARTQPFDILVSDLGLPDSTGLELMTRMQDIQPLPGIAMSGYGMEEDVRKSIAAGFSEHLVKPVKIPQLVAAIQRLVAARAGLLP